MKIVETLDISNPDKVLLGAKHIKLTFNTETDQVAIDTPAMIVDPEVPIETLMRQLEAFWQMGHPDEVYSPSGVFHIRGRCDECGAPCDEEGCTVDRSHEVAKP